MKSLLFIFNPYTGGPGGARLRTRLLEIVTTFSEAGYEVTLHPTTGERDAKWTAAEQGDRYDALVCCGGDGTLNETVEGLLQCKRQPRFGYIPNGTTNDFATSHKLPKNNLLAAAKRFVEPKEIFRQDIGAFNDRIFTYVAAFGAFTDVSYTTNQNAKNAVGYLAYLFQGLGQLPSYQPYKLRIENDGEVLEEEFFIGFISNSSSVAGFNFPKDAGVSLNDGIFELLLIRQPQNIVDMSELSGAFLTKNLSTSVMRIMRTKDLVITSQEPIPWSLDGEYGGEHSEARISVRQNALEICI